MGAAVFVAALEVLRERTARLVAVFLASLNFTATSPFLRIKWVKGKRDKIMDQESLLRILFPAP